MDLDGLAGTHGGHTGTYTDEHGRTRKYMNEALQEGNVGGIFLARSAFMCICVN